MQLKVVFFLICRQTVQIVSLALIGSIVVKTDAFSSYRDLSSTPIQSLIKLFQNYVDKDSQDRKNIEREVFHSYDILFPFKLKVDTIQEKLKDKTAVKRLQDKDVDYWLGGGRFGKRNFDYGLTKTRFGRSVDHVDIS